MESERRPQQVKPDRIVHRITPAGRAELDRWLAEPSVRARGYRDDFFLKVMAAVEQTLTIAPATPQAPQQPAPQASTA